MRSTIILGLALLACILVSTSVHAGYVVEVGVPTMVTTMCLNDGGVNGNSATIRMIDQYGNEYWPATQMVQIADGIFGQNITFNTEGTYTTQEVCNFSGTNVTSGDTYIAKKTQTVNHLEHVPSMTVGGTDYSPGDNGRTFIVLSDNGIDIPNATCLIQIFYPNNTLFVPSTAMTFLSGGVYYYDFTAPSVVGVYVVSAHCTYATGLYQANVSVGTRILGAGAGTATKTDLIDADYWTDVENAGDNRFIAANFTFTGFNASIGSLYSLDVLFTANRPQLGLDPASDPIDIWLFNYNTSQWDLRGSPFSYSATDTSSVTTTTVNISKYISSSGGVAVKINDTIGGLGDVANTILSIDQLNVRLNYKQPNTTVTDISGGSELNIRNSVAQNAVVLAQINSTVNNIQTNVTLIKNDTSLLAQIYTWVLGMFNWVGTDNDQNASTSVPSDVPQSVNFVQAQYTQLESSSVVAQVQKGGLPVTTATCWLNVYYPNMTSFIANGVMSSSGISGMYNYTWTPVVYGSHIAQVNCSGGTITGQVQGSGSLGVSSPNSNVMMQSVG